ncbi:MAG: glycosyltransferase family 2 protein [Bacteroidales bacterium]|nr:glycosyltransferase family 2 protein [Bacteroidales bacterium]
MIVALFWILLFIVFYTFIGYGLFMYLWVRLFRKQPQHENTANVPLPSVTLLIAAYNEELFVKKKMNNSLLLDYPKDKLNIVWVTDGSNDKTNELLSLYPEAKVFFEPERRGKTMAINRVVPLLSDPIIVFTDANTMLNRDAIKEITRPFADEKVGCVAGEKRILVKDSDNAVASGEGFYWKYESFLKKLDSDAYSAIGAAGKLYAIRRSLFRPIDQSFLLDDFMLSMEIASEGYKIVYCPSAYAMEDSSSNIKEETKRKKRIAAGGLQSVWQLRRLLNPFKYGMLSFQFISHRVLRWTVTPLFLLLLLPLNIILVLQHTHWIYSIILSLQILFYLLAIAGYLCQKREIKKQIFFIPYYFLFMNLNVFSGIVYLSKNKGKTGIWEKAQRKMPISEQ